MQYCNVVVNSSRLQKPVINCFKLKVKNGALKFGLSCTYIKYTSFTGNAEKVDFLIVPFSTLLEAVLGETSKALN